LSKKDSNGRKKQKGFSLIELLVAMAILVIVAGTVMAGMISTTRSQGTIMNRTQVHASVRNATELLEQEVGQAGRLATATGIQISAIAAVGAASPTITSSTGLYVGEQIVVDPSSTNEETVTITAIPSATSITATFANTHAANAPVMVLGGFASGIVPPTTSSKYIFSGSGTANTTLLTSQASDGSTLKLYGDINGDGNVYYVVYKCSPNTSGTGTLYRYISTADVTTAGVAMQAGVLLLDNLATNPVDLSGNAVACFTYQSKDTAVTINGGQVTETFVTNVAVTLTVQTQNKDAKTGQYQKETKALLNISPRNVFDAWELASAPSGYTRAQPMPANVLNSLLTATLQ
jgi:prepilin-type N-terminal cleavage/methylation domain-containing protein